MDIREKLSNVRCFLLDMDGTFYLGDRLIEGSLDFLDALKKTGRRNLFLTNNSSKTADVYRNKLCRMGVPEEFCNVLTSGQAAARYFAQLMPGKKAWVFGNGPVLEEMRALGMEITEDDPDYVVLAFDTGFDYRKITRLCDYVRAGLPYFATHPDFNCPTETGFIPDIGATIAYVKASTGREPECIIGKPYKGIVEETLRVTGLQKEEMAMVGDRLYTDIATGVNFGMLSVLVMSGETTEEMLRESEIQPHLTFGRLSDMIPYL